MYEVVIDRYAQKQLSKIPSPHFNRIVDAIDDLANAPCPPGFRIRIGNYRVIYTIEDKILKVFVIDIGHRSGIYD